jgi:hypothetical protein
LVTTFSLSERRLGVKHFWGFFGDFFGAARKKREERRGKEKKAERESSAF